MLRLTLTVPTSPSKTLTLEKMDNIPPLREPDIPEDRGEDEASAEPSPPIDAVEGEAFADPASTADAGIPPPPPINLDDSDQTLIPPGVRYMNSHVDSGTFSA